MYQFECLKGLGKKLDFNKQSKEWIAFNEKKTNKKIKNRKIEKLREMDYMEYLKTDWWKHRRKKFINKFKIKDCYCCKESFREVHHCSYDRIGNEKDKDLVLLCNKCHNEVHNLVLNDKKIKLKEAHEIYKKILILDISNEV